MNQHKSTPRAVVRLLRRLFASTLVLTALCAPPAWAQTATVPSTPVIVPAADSSDPNVFYAKVTWINPAGTGAAGGVRMRAREQGTSDWFPMTGIGSHQFDDVPARITHNLGEGNIIIPQSETGRPGLKPGVMYEVQVAARTIAYGDFSAGGFGRAGQPSDLLAELATLELADSDGGAAFLAPDFDPAVLSYEAYFGASATAGAMTVTAAHGGSIKALKNCAIPPCSAAAETTPDAQGMLSLLLQSDGRREISIEVTPLVSIAGNTRTYALGLNHLPAPPQRFTATASTGLPEPLITLNWVRPPSAHASLYYVHIKNADTAEWPRAEGSDHSLPQGLTFASEPAQIEQSERWSSVIEGFAAEAVYDVRVAGVAGARIGAFSPTLQTRVTFSVPRNAPRNVMISPSNNSLTVHWEAPADSVVEIYKVRWARAPAMGAAAVYLNAGGADGIDTPDNTDTSDPLNPIGPSRNIVGLRNGLEYQVEVAGANSFGIGVWSAPQRGIPSSLQLDAPSDLRLYTATALPMTLLSAARGGAAPYAYSLSGQPAGLVFDADTRILSGTPAAVTALRAYTLTYSVTDSTMPVITRTTTFTIQLAPALRFTPTARSFDPMTPVMDVLAEARDGFPEYTYSLSGALPAGMTFHAATRALSGMPSLAGKFPLVYAVQDALGSRLERDLLLTINAVAPGIPEVQVDSTGEDGKLLVTWSAPAPGGVAAAELTYKVRWATAAAPGTYLNTNAVDGVESDGDSMHTITGLSAGGEYLVAVSAVNTFAPGEWSAPVRGVPSTLTFGEQPDLRFYGNGAVALAQQGGSVQLAQASGGTAPYAYAQTAVSPATGLGLTLASTGVLSGTPGAVSAITPYTYEYTVTDSSTPPLSRRQSVIIQVAPPFTVAADSVEFDADAQVDFALQEGRGGFPPYVYIPREAVLPMGLTFSADNRRVQGIPRVSAEFSELLDRQAQDDTAGAYPRRLIVVELEIKIDPVAPGAPDNVAPAPRRGENGLEVNWDAPIATGGAGAAALTYALRWKSAAETTYAAADAAETAAGATAHIIEPLTPGQSYEVQVRSINNVGMSDWTLAASGRGGTPYNLNDVDGTGGGDVSWQEGVLVIRYLLGLRGAALVDGLGYADAGAVATAAADNIALGVTTGKLDVNGDGKVTAADGILIARYAVGVTGGAALTAGQADAGMTEAVVAKILALQPISGDQLKTLNCIKRPELPECVK